MNPTAQAHEQAQGLEQRLERRLQAVEQENTRLRKRLNRQNGVWLAGLLLLAGGGAMAGATLKNAVFDSVKAKEVVVVDANGIVLSLIHI